MALLNAANRIGHGAGAAHTIIGGQSTVTPKWDKFLGLLCCTSSAALGIAVVLIWHVVGVESTTIGGTIMETRTLY